MGKNKGKKERERRGAGRIQGLKEEALQPSYYPDYSNHVVRLTNRRDTAVLIVKSDMVLPQRSVKQCLNLS